MRIERKLGCVLVETTKFFLCAEISHFYLLIRYAKPSEYLYNINRYIHTIYVYRVPQEECARLREGVSYVKVY